MKQNKQARKQKPARPVILTVEGSWYETIKRTLVRLGADVVTLPSTTGGNLSLIRGDWAEAYSYAHGILLQGGGDIHPSYYHEPVTFSQVSPEGRERDNMECLLATWALRDAKPTLGICRGHQMAAVAAGAALWQDIGEDLEINHAPTQRHMVHLTSPLLTAMFPAQPGNLLRVNSYHHQAVKEVPHGFRLAAISQDGIIEALTGPNVLTVQWHPEALYPLQTGPFKWLVDTAAATLPTMQKTHRTPRCIHPAHTSG